MFSRSIRVTFIDRNWVVIKDKVKIQALPRQGELVYLGEGEEYYKVSNIIHWPNKDKGIFIVIETLSENESRLNRVMNKFNDD